MDPILRIALTGVALALGLGLEGVMQVFVIVPMITSVFSVIWLLRMMHGIHGKPVYEPRKLLRFSSVSWVGNASMQMLYWADSLLLARFVDPSQIAIYQVASRLVWMMGFVMTPINQSFAPRIADLWTRREWEALKRTYVAAAGWIQRLAVPFFVTLVLFAPELLRVFGPGYTAGVFVTVVLAVAKCTDVGTGPCGVMLNQGGQNLRGTVDTVLAVVIDLGLDLILIPRWGINGAAVAWAIAIVSLNVARVFQVRRWVVRTFPFSAESARALVALGISAAAALPVRLLTSGTTALFLGPTVVFASYAAAMLVLGLPEDDRIVVNEIRRQLPAPFGRRGVRPVNSV
jgi:O-antigen/teichoic acid export membrane protein